MSDNVMREAAIREAIDSMHCLCSMRERCEVCAARDVLYGLMPKNQMSWADYHKSVVIQIGELA